jgi:accessory colonization factor AcfC
LNGGVGQGILQIDTARAPCSEDGFGKQQALESIAAVRVNIGLLVATSAAVSVGFLYSVPENTWFGWSGLTKINYNHWLENAI